MGTIHRLKALRLLDTASKQIQTRPTSHFEGACLSFPPLATPASPINTPKHTFAIMSWMDSWSRPSKHQSVPAPFYLLPGGETTPYCHSCGRVINSRRKAQPSAKEDTSNKTPVKYCSTSCRGRRPGKTDREIESVLLRFRKQLSYITSAPLRRNLSRLSRPSNRSNCQGAGFAIGHDSIGHHSLARLGWKCSVFLFCFCFLFF